MSSVSRRLNEVLRKAEEIPFDDSSRFILFNDCHRGDNSWADDFAHNENIFFCALNYYYENEFTYFELGDGDELWENKRFKNIRKAHEKIFDLMRKFHQKKRLYLIWGNHDIERKYPRRVKKDLYRYYNDSDGCSKPLFENIKVHEGLILKHLPTDNKIFLVHGHQGDPRDDILWPVGMLFVRYIWKRLQLLGVKDRTSPAKNFRKRGKVEEKIIQWVRLKNQMIICGHTHRSVLPDDGAPLYFNTGSCVHPYCITGIEIENGEIRLMKWLLKTKADRTLYIGRELMKTPKRLIDFWR